VLPDAALVLSDAHIGYGPSDTEVALHRFLRRVPELANHLVVNGDLFEFWFEYRSVIPRRAFPTLEALAAVRRSGVRLTVTGGNHDRWGGEFWRRELEADYHAEDAELTLAGMPAWIHHGDGMQQEGLGGRLFHAAVRHPVTALVFRMLHPDVGFALVRRMSPFLAGKAKDAATRERATDRQVQHARELLRRREDLRLVVLSHTHAARVERIDGGRWFVNPGAWAAGRRYALITRDGPDLQVWED
jgi:UDP-2,3-diacylglucosamine hydrolase